MEKILTINQMRAKLGLRSINQMEEIKMMSKDVKFIQVKFSETPYKSYCFLTDMKVLKPGDHIVVDTAVGLKVAIFEEYIEHYPFEHAKKAKWAIQKVDVKKHKVLSDINIDVILQSSVNEKKKRELADKISYLEGQIHEAAKELKQLGGF